MQEYKHTMLRHFEIDRSNSQRTFSARTGERSIGNDHGCGCVGISDLHAEHIERTVEGWGRATKHVAQVTRGASDWQEVNCSAIGACRSATKVAGRERRGGTGR